MTTPSFSLPLRNEAQLDAFLGELYDTANPKFHQYITPGEFDVLYGPRQADFETLVKWAEAKGMKVSAKAANNRLIEVDAPVAVVNAAFHVTETTYHDAVRGRDFHAPDVEPTTDLGLTLLQISGLENSVPITNALDKSKVVNLGAQAGVKEGVVKEGGPTAVGGQPQDTNPGTGSLSGYYLPGDMRKAYYTAAGGTLTGSGQTVGIFSFYAYTASDVTAFYTKTGTSTTVTVTTVLVNGASATCPASSCDDTEQVIDIEQVQGMAPGLTKILFYVSTSAATELNQMVMDNTAKVITSSWSGGDFSAASDSYFKQMAAQGQTYLNATGDYGGYNGSTFTEPGTSAYIVEVGGTDLTTSGSAAESWVSETGWSGSAGGFIAGSSAIPAWQQTSGVITAANLGSTVWRNSPDLAAEANNDNVYCSDGCSSLQGGVGGTSLATPRYAGYLALVNQQSVMSGRGTIGFINPTLYAYGVGANKATIFHDMTSGSNASGKGSPVVTYTAQVGYDLITGFGSPNGVGLFNALSGGPVGDFAVTSATGTVTVVRGAGTVTDVMTVGGAPSYNGPVTLSISGMPAGVTATLNTTAIAVGGGTSTATFSATSAVAMGTYPITVTGTAGALTHTAVVNLLVDKRAGSDFTITSTVPASITQGGATSSMVTVTPGSTLVGPVALTLSGAPTGLTATLGATSSTVDQTTTVPLSLTAATTLAPH